MVKSHSQLTDKFEQKAEAMRKLCSCVHLIGWFKVIFTWIFISSLDVPACVGVILLRFKRTQPPHILLLFVCEVHTSLVPYTLLTKH